MPTLEALYRQDPESLPFRQPVDPQLLGIPVSVLARYFPGFNSEHLLETNWSLSCFHFCVDAFEEV